MSGIKEFPIISFWFLVLGLTVFVAQPLRAESELPQFSCPGTKRALVISGGGVKGAYQVGALWYLVNVLGCSFDHYLGTSTGAVTAAVLAQATNREELKTQVELLKTEYEELRSPSQVAKERFLGLLRFFLPRWLGGVDGAATLAPLEQRLRTYIREKRVPYERLTVIATSFQAGILDPKLYRADDIFDLVIGSASIPLAIEPRRARLWIGARPKEMTGNILTLQLDAVPGLPDSNCELRVSPSRVIRCEQLDIQVRMSVRPWSSDIEFMPQLDEDLIIVAQTKLKLSDLSPEDEALISKLIADERKPGVVKGSPFQFSSVHQIVDGGVTQNIPLAHAIRLIGKEQRFDTIFTLLTGHSPALGTKADEVHGGREILGTTFEILWEAYQTGALRAAERYLRINKIVCGWFTQQKEVLAWRRELAEKLGPGKLAEIEKSMQRFPVEEGLSFFDPVGWIADDCKKANWERWDILTFDPGQSEIQGPLSVESEKIRVALGQGCVVAAAAIHSRLTLESKGSVSSDESQKYAQTVCRPLVHHWE